ncbi:MAG: SusC/RagA family TonB-linked outer membrane protein [Prevotellaceae bacterium]|nr:SusC/RagA family TonB-linked outer membrane protein [Prevotellaceae bacterium]
MEARASKQQFIVSGTISDDSGEKLVGVAVVIKGTNIGVISDDEGNYSISAPNSDAVLVFSYVGYGQLEMTVGSQTVINVTLKPSTELGEVVVTALGITKEAKALGYAVSTIKASELTKVGTTNFASALYGKAAGVRITAAPGGSTSAVSISVRGLSSITGNNQPLLVMDGVPIRNGNANNGEDQNKTSRGWDNDHIQGNGIIDINPEDIENISILKGAAATALYGSEAANGVILVTSKKGTGKGLSVDFNTTLSANIVAYMPEVQTEFGPGRESLSWDEHEMASGGFLNVTHKGQDYIAPWYKGTHAWGPAYDGRQVLYWDGKTRAYNAQTNAPWTDLFRTGFNQKYNIAISYGGDKSNTRFSYTYVNDTPNQLNSNYNKHNFNIAGGMKISEKVRIDYSANYIREYIYNRPFNINWMFSSFNGVANSFVDMNYFKKHIFTSRGYRNVVYDSQTPSSNTLTPDESFVYLVPYHEALNNYIWPVLANKQDEIKNRFIASVSPSWKIIDGLTLRGRLSTDLTSETIEQKEATVTPLLINANDPKGGFGIIGKSYEIYYGDLMLMFDRNLSKDVNLTANIGFQGRQEIARGVRLHTRDGLSTENWFHINASRSNPEVFMDHVDLLKTAFFGTLGVSYLNSLFLEGTMRQEKSSTLRKGFNSYYYPSVNASYIFSEQLKNVLPWWNYGKLRASYGMVGNAPDAYAASVSYVQKSTAGFTYSHVETGDYGNENIKPETKYEFELGMESRLLGSRLSFEVSYYNNRVVDQILRNSVPLSSGAMTTLQNVGELRNYGVELTLGGIPVETENFRWELRFNYSFNRNKVVKLSNGANFIDNGGIDTGGGQVELRSYVGRPMGDLYVVMPKMVNDKKIIIPDGQYAMDQTTKKFIGNVLPDAVGGFSSSLSYKNLSLDFMLDYRIGGYVTNWGYQYTMARGTNPESLQYRDEARGGYAYYYTGDKPNISNIVWDDGNGNPIGHNHSTPHGERLFHDGMKLDGLIEDASGTIVGADGVKYREGAAVVPVSRYNNYTYNWGPGCDYSESIFDNSYLKLREISISYRIPETFTSKFGCKNISVSAFGRNLFYIFKNMKGFDAESTTGTDWIHQAVIGGSTATTRTIGFSLRASF